MAGSPEDSVWSHHRASANGIAIHYVRQSPAAARGEPLVLLHGWPEFWYAWRKNIPVLARSFDVIAPDLRGFGDSDKPAGTPTLDDYAADLAGLLDALGIDRARLVSHDVGASVAQAFALAHPERVAGLFFFNCPYPGIGRRWADAGHINEIWYQSFNQLDWAPELLRSSREACRLFLSHFLSHWAGEPGVFAGDLEIWVDNLLKPGNLEGGGAWYKCANEARLALIRGGAAPRPMIDAPTFVLWGAEDPILKAEWSDALGDYFTDVTVEIVANAGHFVFYEQPDLANARIAAFFGALPE